jgi:hypothetical protein
LDDAIVVVVVAAVAPAAVEALSAEKSRAVAQ